MMEQEIFTGTPKMRIEMLCCEIKKIDGWRNRVSSTDAFCGEDLLTVDSSSYCELRHYFKNAIADVLVAGVAPSTPETVWKPVLDRVLILLEERRNNLGSQLQMAVSELLNVPCT